MFVSNYKKINAGLTLIELLIAVALSTILTMLLISMFVIAQRSFKLQEALSSIAYQANEVIYVLRENIHHAGIMGCSRLTEQMITGNQNEITIKRRSIAHVTLIEPMQNFYVLYTSSHPIYHAGDILIISNCTHTDIFTVAKASMTQQKQKIITTQPLKHLYTSNAEVGKIEINQFYTAKISRKYPDGKSVYALFLRDIHLRKYKLLDNISDLHLQYVTNANQITAVQVDFKVTAITINKTWHAYIAAGM